MSILLAAKSSGRPLKQPASAQFHVFPTCLCTVKSNNFGSHTGSASSTFSMYSPYRAFDQVSGSGNAWFTAAEFCHIPVYFLLQSTASVTGFCIVWTC